MIELLVATGNTGKLREIRRLLSGGSPDVKVYGLQDLDISADCPETGETFADNAEAKSLFYGALAPGFYSLGEDSGLSVGALGGAPGIYSARYAGVTADDDENIRKLLRELQGYSDRRAKFVTALCLSRDGQVVTECSGEVEGEILGEPRGENGFGYDPVFYYSPLDRTFAELSTEEKNRVSHRARALRDLKAFFETMG